MRILTQLSALCFAMFFCGTTTADTEDLTAEKFRDLCISKNEMSQLSCIAYISGFRDGNQTGMMIAATRILGLAEFSKSSSTEEDYQRYSYFCVPTVVSNTQLKEVFVKYMNEHPEQLHQKAAVQLSKSFIQNFPCKPEIKGGAK